MEFTIDQINRETVEGKLLIAAMNWLNDFTDRSPNEMIKMLWDTYKKTEAGENQSMKSATIPSEPLRRALNISFERDKQAHTEKMQSLMNAGDIILKFAIPSMEPHEYENLTSILVKLTKHYWKGVHPNAYL